MYVMKGILLSSLALSISACASMSAPNSSLIDNVTVVKMGDEKPEGKDYILHIPANTEFPVHFTVKGDLIANPVDLKPRTKLNKDIYVYKYWSSFNGRDWQPSHDLINMPIGVGMGTEGGQVHVKVDLVNK